MFDDHFGRTISGLNRYYSFSSPDSRWKKMPRIYDKIPGYSDFYAPHDKIAQFSHYSSLMTWKKLIMSTNTSVGNAQVWLILGVAALK